MKALLLDNDGFVAESLVLAMQMKDPTLNVTMCRSTAEARALLASHKYDLLFLDIALNEGTRAGLAFLAQLKEAGDETRVIMLSATDDTPTVFEAISLGATGFLSKGAADMSSFRTAIDVILNKGIYLPPELVGAKSTPPPSQLAPHRPAAISTIGSDELGVTTRQYEALFHLSNGCQCKTIARKMNIEDTTADELLRNAYAKLNVKGQLGFMVMLNKNGWNLAEPATNR